MTEAVIRSGRPVRPQTTEALTRGVCRFLTGRGLSVVREFSLKSKRRADITALDHQGQFIIVEVKSSVDDFRADKKWLDYIAHCDVFYFAVTENFPIAVLPDERGLIVADGFGAAIVRDAVPHPMNGNRRRKQLLNFARAAADRLEQQLDQRLTKL